MGQQPITSQLIIDSTKATPIASGGPDCMLIMNTGSTDVWLGNSNVKSSTGILLLGVKGFGLKLSLCQDWYGITASGSAVVAVAIGDCKSFFLSGNSLSSGADLASLLNNIVGWLVNRASSLIVGIGDVVAGGVGTFLIQNSTATECPTMRVTSQAIPNGQAAIFSNNNTTTSRGPLAFWKMRCRIASTGPAELFYACLTDVNPGVALMQNTPTTQNIIGFRFATGEANWTCVACDASGSSVVADSGVPVDTNMHVFMMKFAGGSVQYYIDGVQVATISTLLPAAATQLGSVMTIQANALQMFFSFMWYGHVSL